MASSTIVSRVVERNGEKKTIADWALQYGLLPRVVAARLRVGWDLERALTTPNKWAKPPERRAINVNTKRISKRDLLKGLVEFPRGIELSYARPRTRGDCLQGNNVQRPCPFASCKHHLGLGVDSGNGTIRLTYGQVEIWELRETCTLDVADEGGITLEETASLLNLTRERCRQIEVSAMKKLHRLQIVNNMSRDLDKEITINHKTKSKPKKCVECRKVFCAIGVRCRKCKYNFIKGRQALRAS